jgi:hypothetical protein
MALSAPLLPSAVTITMITVEEDERPLHLPSPPVFPLML